MQVWNLTVRRKWYTNNTTTGELYINGSFFCYTLEDVCRDLNRDGDLNDPGEKKVPGKTCIPAGRYQVIIDMSYRFRKLMPLLIGILGFAGIRIHAGNYAVDTDGCILLGSTRSIDFVGNSRDTFAKFMVRLQLLLKTGKVYITIIDEPVNGPVKQAA
ncbi:hypothetical protein EOD41_10740 [Mucilaginibacter limnophilus]|uniref:DUF5675 domain-containing protein n=1 Tax=Mucilaginibacter limnophilus TaxID=1932778 RepID=A0A3S2VMW7_9SPHI|nr:DUF5675 family protein [Mucilaginibacter limnophilus]RVU01083.1 hypothetical protein EOD41_10740 [Mucilaginibacter limnophilus]